MVMEETRAMVASSETEDEAAGYVRPEIATDNLDDEEPKPTVQGILDEMAQLDNVFVSRDQEIADMRAYTRLEKLAVTEKFADESDDDMDNLVTYLSTPNTIVAEYVRRIATSDMVISVAAEEESPEERQRANDLAAIARHFLERNNQRWRLGGGSDGIVDACVRAAAEDGHLFIRITAEPRDADCPARMTVLDTLECRPVYIDGGNQRMVRFYRKYMTTVEKARRAYPKAKKALAGRESMDEVECIAYYDSKWHAVVLNEGGNGSQESGTWLSPPAEHFYGFIPIVSAHFQGQSSLSAKYANQTVEERERNRGHSVIYFIKDELDRLADTMSLLFHITRMVANPTIIMDINAADGETPEGEIRPGGVVLTKNAKVSTLQLYANQMPYLQDQVQTIMANIRASVGVLDLERGQSGAQDLMTEQRNTKLRPYYRGVAETLASVFEKALHLYGMFADQITMRHTSADGYDYKRLIDPDIINERPLVKVRFDEMTKAERIQGVIAGRQAVEGLMLSRYTLLENLGYENPAVEMQRIRQEMAWISPTARQIIDPVLNYDLLMQEFTDSQAENTGPTNPRAALILNLLNQLIKQTTQAGQGGPPAPPGGGGPPPGLAQMLAAQGGPPPLPQMGPGMMPPPQQLPMPPMPPMLQNQMPPMNPFGAQNAGIPPGVLPPETIAPGIEDYGRPVLPG